MEKTIPTRNKEHELIVVALYDALLYVDMEAEFDVEEIIANSYGLDIEDVPLFGKEVIIKSLKNLNEISDVFQAEMKTWKFSRLNTLERAILITSYTEVKMLEDIDRKIAIDVAIRLAKKYLDKDDYKFVNAILDKVL